MTLSLESSIRLYVESGGSLKFSQVRDFRFMVAMRKVKSGLVGT